MSRAVYLVLVFFSLITFGSFESVDAQPPGFKKLEIGDRIPEFELPGVDGKTYQVSDFKNERLLFVIFTCNHCPTAQAYETRIKKLHEEYHERGVQLLAITPNDPKAVRLDELGYSDLGDSLEETKQRANEIGFEFPYLFDGDTQKTSLEFGVLATPHVFIFDQDRKLRYKGRIDDSEVGVVKSQDARNALESLLDGKPVAEPVTRPFGCSTKWFTKRESARKAIEKWDSEPVELEKLSPDSLRKLAANDSENYRLINVWATWCIPCVEELPEFVEINRMYRNRNFEMITISADESDQQNEVLAVLKKKKLACKNFLFDSDDRDELFEGLDPQWEGGVPYTVLIAPGGEVVYRKHDEIDPAKLKSQIADLLGRTYASRKSKPAAKKQTGKQDSSDNKQPASAGSTNLQKSNLVAWCIVPFDAKQRGPKERSQMLKRLGLQRVAYDWRAKHVDEFEEEIKQYQKNGIEFFAFWNWHDSIEPLIRQYEVRPQIWFMIPKTPETETADKVRAAAESLLPMVKKTAAMGLKLGLYNHGGWEGEPENMVAVCNFLRENHDAKHVGIVYNFHHGHEHIDRFEDSLDLMMPYLFCLNLNGMVDRADFDSKVNKILPIGKGQHEAKLIRTLVKSGYGGPVGILDHRNDMDAEESLKQNLDGLSELLSKMDE